MLRIPLLFLAFSLACSCGSNAESEAIRLQDSISEHDSTITAIRNAKVTRLQELRDSIIKASFGTDMDGDYIHIYWSNTLSPKKNGFAMIVTSTDGIFYYLSKAENDARYSGQHNTLRIYSAESAFEVSKNADVKGWPSTIDSSNGCDHVVFYDYTGVSMADFITRHQNEELTIWPMHDDDKTISYVLSTEDKQAVADCLLLSRVLVELRDLYYY